MSTPVDLDKALPNPAGKLDPPPPRLQRALKAFEDAVGGRDVLVAELATAQLNDKESLALRLLADPGNDGMPLHEILGYSRLSVADFLRVFKNARGARAYLAAMDAVWQKLPDVAADVMARALPTDVKCLDCNATGHQAMVGYPRGVTRQARRSSKYPGKRILCGTCHGTGRKAVEPTLDYQRLALTLGGLPKPIPGTFVDNSKTQINAQQQNFYGSDTMRGFIEAVARVKYGPAPRVQEAEVVTEDEEPV